MAEGSKLAEPVAGALLTVDDTPPVAIYNPAGRSPFLLIGDHAGALVPDGLAKLGLPEAELGRHIALDIGVAALGQRMADLLDATFIHQRYSRLVIDCNRAPDRDDAILAVSDGTAIPGNVGLTRTARGHRVEAIQQPYQRAIADELARRAAGHRPAVLVSLHSFTPVLATQRRPWHIGILYDGGETRFARRVLALLAADASLCIGDNEPYRMDDIDFTVPRHAYGGGLAYVEVEVRQDCLAAEESFERMAAVLSCALGRALDSASEPVDEAP